MTADARPMGRPPLSDDPSYRQQCVELYQAYVGGESAKALANRIGKSLVRTYVRIAEGHRLAASDPR